MPELVTKEDAYQHLRLDADSNGSADDLWLDVFIPAISAAVARWVKIEARLYVPEVDSSGAPVLDSGGEPVPAEPLVVLPLVKAAVLLELASVYRYREGEGTDNVVPSHEGFGFVLNKASTALLTPLRRPTVR